MSFFSRGFDGVDRDVQTQADNREKSSARRIWMKPNTSTNVVFLDEEPIRFEEYRLWKGEGTKPVFATRSTIGRDHFLSAGYKPDSRYAFSVIDCSSWIDPKSKKEYVNQKRLLVVTADVAKLLRDKKVSWGGLKHKAVTIRRKGAKDSSSGSDFEPVMKNGQMVAVNMKAFKDIEPFNYEKVLAPPSDDEAIRLIGEFSKGHSVSSPIAGDEALPAGDIPPPNDAPAAMDDSGSDEIPF